MLDFGLFFSKKVLFVKFSINVQKKYVNERFFEKNKNKANNFCNKYVYNL